MGGEGRIECECQYEWGMRREERGRERGGNVQVIGFHLL